MPAPLFPLQTSLFDFAGLPCARHSPGSSPWVNSVANQILIRCRTEPDPVAIALQANKSVSKGHTTLSKSPRRTGGDDRPRVLDEWDFQNQKHILYAEPVAFDCGGAVWFGAPRIPGRFPSPRTIFEALPCARPLATFDFLYMRPSGHLFMCVTFVVVPVWRPPIVPLVLERVIVIAMYLIRVPGIP